MTLDIKAVNVSKHSTFTVTRAYHYPNLGSRGHVADIIVTQPEYPEEPPLFETVSMSDKKTINPTLYTEDIREFNSNQTEDKKILLTMIFSKFLTLF